MLLAFVDDSAQRSPSRDGMRPLVAAGAVVVDGDAVGGLLAEIEATCDRYGFPDREEFKWSPSGSMWMRQNLVHPRRNAFFGQILDACRACDATAIIAISERGTGAATDIRADTFLDTVTMLLERIDSLAGEHRTTVAVTVDQPGGASRQATSFVEACQQVLQDGTQYSHFDNTPLNIVTANSRHHRLLQVADVVTGATTALVGGESRFSPDVFDHIKPLLRHDFGCIGGRGLKLHSHYRLVNLYHWVLGDTHYWYRGFGQPLPMPGFPYADLADVF